METRVYGQPINQVSREKLERALVVTRRGIMENKTGIGLVHLFVSELELVLELDRRNICSIYQSTGEQL